LCAEVIDAGLGHAAYFDGSGTSAREIPKIPE
jgi:hypothetical protein